MALQWNNLSDSIFYYAERNPDAAAIYEGTAKLTYSELAILIGKASIYLHDLGLTRGDLVGISLPTNAEHLVLFFAALRIGAVPVDIPMRRPSQIDPFEQ